MKCRIRGTTLARGSNSLKRECELQCMKSHDDCKAPARRETSLPLLVLRERSGERVLFFFSNFRRTALRRRTPTRPSPGVLGEGSTVKPARSVAPPAAARRLNFDQI